MRRKTCHFTMGKEAQLSLWIPRDFNEQCSQYIHDYLCEETTHIVYYIDSINSFPIHDLQRITKDTTIFDRIQMITCLDMVELQSIVLRIVKSGGEMEGKIIIHGIDTMMTNSTIQMSNNKDQIYKILNHILLQLRFYPIGSRIISEYTPTVGTAKRRRGNDKKWNDTRLDNNVMEYINKYYCDEEVI